MTAPARLGPVLVVDDEVHLNLLVSSILKLHGCEVITAQNGQQGLDAVRERRDVKVIVTDLNMPVLDGFGMLNAVRALGVNAPVIVLTARGDHRDQEQASTLGAHAFLTKPFSRQQLWELVEPLLQP
ncbi:response regulator transcription factor [Deinococcus aquiradiocola]|uniref:Response regulatory domain-containing protein n=1 Tax=Deinococcus aquiradiocola TaxID=393059 RepID=A0A917UN10_9DEIO|nr:response regulator [Deinococcus aquiradiocola]GGJ69882.1 hypothetical protein GCM10008939_12840 [Deinococcus aquiradiocola]